MEAKKKNSRELFHELTVDIRLPETKQETESIAYQVIEFAFGITQTDVLAEKNIWWSDAAHQNLERIVKRINNQEPIQYIFKEAEFFGRKFNVTPSVLIPRPETEELTEQVIDKIKQFFPSNKKIKVLDVGAGSGCIPITVKLELPQAEVFATDISEGALQIAQENATTLKADVMFLKHDILNENLPLDQLDVVVSNPPYIPLQEKASMKKNVVAYEPEVALFVSDEDPLLFYKAISSKSMKALNQQGFLMVEINERYGNDVAILFRAEGFSDVKILKDLSGKDRMVFAQKV